MGRTQSLIRWRAGFAFSAVLLPAALFLLFERQAKRLDALAHHGELVEARTTGVSRDNSITFYAYEVGGSEYTWNVKRSDAPYAIGKTFSAAYLPEDPSLSRPYSDRTLAAIEAAANRKFSFRFEIAIGLTLFLFAVLAHRGLRQLRSGVPLESADPKAYKKRLVTSAVLMMPAIALVGSFHVADAVEKGRSLVPSAIGLGLSIAIIGSTLYLGGRDGPIKAKLRSAKVLKWTVPIVVAITLLRLLAMIFDK